MGYDDAARCKGLRWGIRRAYNGRVDQTISSPAPLGSFSFEKRQAIQKVRYSHDGMIELIIKNPWISQNELAAHFGYTAGWVSQVIASDAFQEKMAERKKELVDPAILATIEERFKALVVQSFEILKRKLENSPSDDLALGVMNGAAKALGYGARPAATTQVNNSFVVQLPPKSASSADWVKDHAPPAADQPSRPLLPKVQSDPIKEAEIVSERALAPQLKRGTPEEMLAELMEK